MADRTYTHRFDANPFTAKTILWLLVAGLGAFAGFLLLMAYAPKWDRIGNGGAHILSKSAVGFSGLYALQQAVNGDDAMIINNRDGWYTKGLLVVPIEQNMDPAELEALVRVRQAPQMDGATTLYILPKWQTRRDPKRRNWVQQTGTNPGVSNQLTALLGDVTISENTSSANGRITGIEGINQPAPPNTRYIGKGTTPILTDSRNRTVLGRIENSETPAAFILSEPDLLSNHALKTRDGAAAAMRIIQALRPDGGGDIAFTGRLSGSSDDRNLLQLMFEPPFLAFTLALVAAALLIGFHALGRFGPPAAESRAIPFGKRALADNVATLVARAGRERQLGDRYVAVVRDAAAAALGAGHLASEPLEAWLDTLPGGFADLARAARSAPDAAAMQLAAVALFQWQKDVTRDH